MPVKQDESRNFHLSVKSGGVFYDLPVSGEPQVVNIDAEEAVKFAKELLKAASWAANRDGGGSCRIYLWDDSLHAHTSLNFPRYTRQELAHEAKLAKSAKAGK